MNYKCRVFCERVINIVDEENKRQSTTLGKVCAMCHRIMEEEGTYCKACTRKLNKQESRRSYSN